MFLLIHVKKDLLIEDQEVNLLQAPSGVTTISLDELQQKIKIKKFDTYSSVLANNLPQDGKLRIREDLYLYTDKITIITSNGVTSYTMAVQQNSKQRATFQNVTFVDRAGVIETYLLTYKASKDWAAKLRKDKKAPFEGYFSYSKLDSKNSKTGENKTSAAGCENFTYYYRTAYQCIGPHGDVHWPWESGCVLEGESGGAGYILKSTTIEICRVSGGNTWVSGLTDGTSGGGSGGSTPTYPTLPLNYNPDCDYGNSVANSATASGVNTSAVGDGDCAYENPNPAGLIANINKLTGILGLSWAEQEFLHSRDAIQGQTFTSDFLAYLTVNGLLVENIDFANSMFDYTMQNPSLTSADFTSQFLSPNIFSLPYTVINSPQEAPIENGVTVETASGPASTETPRLLASTGGRGNTEDLLHGVNGNTNGILAHKLDDTDTQLFQDMENLFNTFTVLDGELRTEGYNMIDRFRSRTGGTYESPVLNYRVRHNVAMINTIKRFGELLNGKLQIDGEIGNISTFELDRRPIFNRVFDKFQGFQILFNDTEQTDIYIESFTMNPTTGVWVATIQVKMVDHFGLDKNDAIRFQNSHYGFASWWILQHRRDYHPFNTLATFRINVSSSIH